MPCHRPAPPCSSVFSFSPMSKSAIGSPLFLLFVSLLLFLLLLRTSVRPSARAPVRPAFLPHSLPAVRSILCRNPLCTARGGGAGEKADRRGQGQIAVFAVPDYYKRHTGDVSGGWVDQWSVSQVTVVCCCKFAPYVMGESCGLAYYGIVLTGKSKLNDDAIGNETLFVFPTFFAVILSHTLSFI